jgi:hypothetical protein
MMKSQRKYFAMYRDLDKKTLTVLDYSKTSHDQLDAAVCQHALRLKTKGEAKS